MSTSTPSGASLGKRAVEVRLNAALPDVKKKLEGLKGLKGEDLTKALAKAGFEVHGPRHISGAAFSGDYSEQFHVRSFHAGSLAP